MKQLAVNEHERKGKETADSGTLTNSCLYILVIFLLALVQRDSRIVPHMDMNAMVDGYKIGDVVRAQRYLFSKFHFRRL